MQSLIKSPDGLLVTVTLCFIAIGLLIIVFDVSPMLIVIIFMAGYMVYLEYDIRSKNRT
jgi:hypothetical protein